MSLFADEPAVRQTLFDGSSLNGWVLENAAEGTRPLTRIHDLEPSEIKTQALFQSRRNKMMLRVLEDGTLHFDYPTNERHLLNIDPETPLTHVALNTRANGVAGLFLIAKYLLFKSLLATRLWSATIDSRRLHIVAAYCGWRKIPCGQDPC